MAVATGQEEREEEAEESSSSSPSYRSHVGGKPEWEKNLLADRPTERPQYRSKFSEGQKVWERIERNRTDGPWTVVSVFSDDPKTFRYKVKSADGLVYREIYESNLQKKET
ncbi:hypothetical protein GP486_004870 [Trichoglossum hirsutum]|uniref:Uncharacterized protein n=1 Tax=Trichoglossum hirsutum TaxID=265104 RepID=A0A9P8LA70_9PEZI|nr:hypothetical protein GP486_004870 [Trichoglossum hirsutum]